MNKLLFIAVLSFAFPASSQVLPRLYANKKVWGKLIAIEDKRIKVNRTDSMTANYITINLVFDNMASDTTAKAMFRVEYVAKNSGNKLSLKIEHVTMGWSYYLNSWNANNNEATIQWVINQVGVALKSN